MESGRGGSQAEQIHPENASQLFQSSASQFEVSECLGGGQAALDEEDEGCDGTKHARTLCCHAGQGSITTVLALTRSLCGWRSLRRETAVSLSSSA